MEPVFAIKFFGALFAIMNPLTNLPIFLSLTGSMSVSEQRHTAIQVVIYSAIMCAVVAVAGQQILNFFGIHIDGFRVAGGAVLTGIAFNMLNGNSVTSHHGTASEHAAQSAAGGDSVAFYPLTFPILVGPGSITTLIVFLQQADSAINYAAYAAVVAATIGMLGITFYFAASIGARLSLTLRVIMTRLMGMILLAIAIEMLATGLLKLLPGLAS